MKRASEDHKINKEIWVRLAKEIERIFGKSSSRVEIAEKIGIADTSIRNWEKGGGINSSALILLAQRGVDILYVLTGNRSSANREYTEDQEVMIEKVERDIKKIVGLFCEESGNLARLFEAMQDLIRDPVFAKEFRMNWIARNLQERK